MAEIQLNVRPLDGMDALKKVGTEIMPGCLTNGRLLHSGETNAFVIRISEDSGVLPGNKGGGDISLPEFYFKTNALLTNQKRDVNIVGIDGSVISVDVHRLVYRHQASILLGTPVKKYLADCCAGECFMFGDVPFMMVCQPKKERPGGIRAVSLCGIRARHFTSTREVYVLSLKFEVPLFF